MYVPHTNSFSQADNYAFADKDGRLARVSFDHVG